MGTAERASFARARNGGPMKLPERADAFNVVGRLVRCPECKFEWRVSSGDYRGLASVRCPSCGFVWIAELSDTQCDGVSLEALNLLHKFLSRGT